MARALVMVGGLGTGAFQAGAVAALAGAGIDWDVVVGSGAGALNALLVADGRVETMLRLWREQASGGVPVIADLADRASAAAGAAVPGARASLDPRAVQGLVSTAMVTELAEPWTAGLEARLRVRGRRLLLPILDLAEGRARLVEPTAELHADQLAAAVAAAASTPVACLPVPLRLRDGAPPRPCVDGLGALPRPLRGVVEAAGDHSRHLDGFDLVVGIPPTAPGASVSPLGLAEVAAAVDAARVSAALEAELEALAAAGLGVTVIRPDLDSWRRFTGRDDADLRLEFPGAVTRNGALLELTADYGRWLASPACD